MLAYQLKQIENKHSIPVINDCNGSPKYNQKQINQAFQEYYSSLYKPDYQANNVDMETFLNDLSLPTLDMREKKSLEASVLETEAISAFKALSTGKTPGDDGYSQGCNFELNIRGGWYFRLWFKLCALSEQTIPTCSSETSLSLLSACLSSPSLIWYTLK